MRWDDMVYGGLDIPGEIWRLFANPILIRLRGLAQAVLPLEINPFTATTRFSHAIGVWWLAERLVARQEFKHLDPVLPFAGLLHDAGNPPFSHIAEPFMREANGYDGETHLRKILLGSRLAHELNRLRADPNFICDLVSGAARPWSDLLAGSIDLDNADNVIRYMIARGLTRPKRRIYDPYRIVDGFCLSPNKDAIELRASALSEVRRWQQVRRLLYESVYGYPQQALEMMIVRALEFAFEVNELPPEFWQLTDAEGLRHLQRCNPATRELADMVANMQPYLLVAAWDGTSPPFVCDWNNWRVRKAVSDKLADVLGLHPWETAAHLSIGKDRRAITLATRSSDGIVTSADREADRPRYRIQLYMQERWDGLLPTELYDVPAFAHRAIRNRRPEALQSST